jgi:hypothetical protein
MLRFLFSTVFLWIAKKLFGRLLPILQRLLRLIPW